MESRFVTIKVFSDRLEAELAKQLLNANNIQSFVSADDAGGMRPGIFAYSSGAELIVREQDFQKAKEVLNSVQPLGDGSLY